MAAALPVLKMVAPLVGTLMSSFGGGKAPSPPTPAPPPPPPPAPEPEKFVEPEGVQDEAATRARALRRREESANKGGLLNLQGSDDKSSLLSVEKLSGK